jgi:hypothetical protein
MRPGETLDTLTTTIVSKTAKEGLAVRHCPTCHRPMQSTGRTFVCHVLLHNLHKGA